MYLFSCQHIIVFSWQPFHRPLQGEGVPARVTIGIEVLLLCAFTAKQGTSFMKLYFDVAGTGTEMSITRKQLLIWELVVMERAGYAPVVGRFRGKGKGQRYGKPITTVPSEKEMEPAHQQSCFPPSMAPRMLACVPCLEKAMATHSSVLAWRITGTGKPGELQSMGSHRVGHD